MRMYRCEFLDIIKAGGERRLRVRMLEDHIDPDAGQAGHNTVTSNVRSIDFERGVAITQNSLYHWEVK